MKMLLTQIDSKLKWLMIVDDIWKNIIDMVFDDVRTGVDDLKVAVYPNVSRKCEICFEDRFEVCSQFTIFLSSRLSLPRLHHEILLFSKYQLSSWEALTSFFLKIQLLKVLSLLHLKCCDVGILLDKISKMMILLCFENVKRTVNPPWFFKIRGRKGKDVLVPVTPKRKSVEVWWSLDREIAFLSIQRFIRRYTRCFEWRLNPSKHDLLSSNEGRVFC